MHAIRALAAAKAVAPYFDDILHSCAFGAIGNAVAQARTRVKFNVDGDMRAQDALATRLKGEGYKIDWDISGGPRTDDSAVMIISWGE